MNKNQRRNKTFRSDGVTRSKLAHELSSVTKNPIGVRGKTTDKSMVNRCCLVHPKQKDFGQKTSLNNVEALVVPPSEGYASILAEQYGFNPSQTGAVTEVGEGKNVLCGEDLRVEMGSQNDCVRSSPGSKYVETVDGTHWQNIDNTSDVDKYIQATINEESPIEYHNMPKSIHISDIPKVKIIVEKFSKFKRNNVELRRLDEKVVCVEYDVYDYGSTRNIEEPIQKMRAYFSVKPSYEEADCEALPVPELPAKIKNQFNIEDKDLKNLTMKEIEMIDDKIENNKCYLDDLRRILRRRHLIQINRNKEKGSINLRTLYEIARREKELFSCDFTNTNIFTKSELIELKDLIIKRCASSVHGITRRKVKNFNKNKLADSVVSGSIVSALLR